MALEAPEQGYRWLHVPTAGPIEVTVLGEIHTWWAHFQRRPGGRGTIGVRCGKSDREECPLCGGGTGSRARYVFPVRHEDAVKVLELGRTQFPFLAGMQGDGNWIGRRLRLWHEWQAANAPISLVPLGREYLSEEARVDLGELVYELGRYERSLVMGARTPTPSKAGPVSDMRRAYEETIAAQNGRKR